MVANRNEEGKLGIDYSDILTEYIQSPQEGEETILHSTLPFWLLHNCKSKALKV